VAEGLPPPFFAMRPAYQPWPRRNRVVGQQYPSV